MSVPARENKRHERIRTLSLSLSLSFSLSLSPSLSAVSVWCETEDVSEGTIKRSLNRAANRAGR